MSCWVCFNYIHNSIYLEFNQRQLTTPIKAKFFRFYFIRQRISWLVPCALLNIFWCFIFYLYAKNETYPLPLNEKPVLSIIFMSIEYSFYTYFMYLCILFMFNCCWQSCGSTLPGLKLLIWTLYVVILINK